jgi:hypothetical protein
MNASLPSVKLSEDRRNDLSHEAGEEQPEAELGCPRALSFDPDVPTHPPLLVAILRSRVGRDLEAVHDERRPDKLQDRSPQGPRSQRVQQGVSHERESIRLLPRSSARTLCRSIAGTALLTLLTAALALLLQMTLFALFVRYALDWLDALASRLTG